MDYRFLVKYRVSFKRQGPIEGHAFDVAVEVWASDLDAARAQASHKLNDLLEFSFLDVSLDDPQLLDDLAADRESV